MAKNVQRFLALAVIAILVITITIMPASARQRYNFILIGGDGDNPRNDNNLYRQSVNGYLVSDLCDTTFVNSVSGDYSNETAQKQALIAERALSTDAINIVAAYSHGGQSLYFMNLSKVSDVFLFDACAKIRGVCNNPDTCSETWFQWIVNLAKRGVNVHLFATDGKRDISRASAYTVNSIYEFSKNSRSKKLRIEFLGKGVFQVFVNGEASGIIEAVNVGQDHGAACINAAPFLIDYLFRM